MRCECRVLLQKSYTQTTQYNMAIFLHFRVGYARLDLSAKQLIQMLRIECFREGFVV